MQCSSISLLTVHVCFLTILASEVVPLQTHAASALSEWTGIEFGAYSTGSIKIVSILALSPAGICGQLAVGDLIISVDGQKIVQVHALV
jgi:C-terminal processing protease CtpA/Prc